MGFFSCLLDPGEVVVTPAPSWNNDNFAQLVGARMRRCPAGLRMPFMPTAEALVPHLKAARLLVLCSPYEPANHRSRRAPRCWPRTRGGGGGRAAALRRLLIRSNDVGLRDQAPRHARGVAPEMAKYTIFCDAISKSLRPPACGSAGGGAAGGGRLRALLTHMGAWAPGLTVATARLLRDADAMTRYLTAFKAAVRARLDVIHEAFEGFAAEGLPVRGHIAPRAHLPERLPGVPDRLGGEDAVREYLLEAAGCAVLPFSVFGDTTNRLVALSASAPCE
ncbi:MAG: hypothetical protein R3F43_15745 [bacterium]